MSEDGEVDIDVLANDDANGGTLSLVSVGSASNGTTTALGDGRARYTPDPDFHGTDQFTYTASNGSGTSSATVTVTVQAVNDPPTAPVVTAPSEGAQISLAGDPSAPVLFAWSAATDVDGDALSYTLQGHLGGGYDATPGSISKVVSGTSTSITRGELADLVSSVGAAGGTLAFRVVASDGTAETPGQERSVVLETAEFTASSDAAVVSEDSEVDIDVLANDDANGGTLSLVSVGSASNGTTTALGDGRARYTPDPDFHGTDQFTYTASNGSGTSSATVTVTVQAVNDPPTAPVITAPASNAEINVAADPTTPVIFSWTAATDVDGDALTYTLEGNVLVGSGSLEGDMFIDAGSETTVSVTVGDLALLLNSHSEGTLGFSVVVSDGTAETHSQSRFVKLTRTVFTASSDSLALVALYNAMDGPNWTRKENWLAGPIGSWQGVTVDATDNRVTRINLARNQLIGSIPPEIGQFSRLEHLQLQQNALMGSIPPEIGQLASLRVLSLFLNQLSGSIPLEVGQLSNLESFGLGNNQLEGALPASLGQLANLEKFDANSNKLDGPLPSEIGQLDKLEWLIVHNTFLRGPVPTSYTALTALTIFQFDKTQLCEPDDEGFRAWLSAVETVSRTNVVCEASTAAESLEEPMFSVGVPVPNPARGEVSIRYQLMESAIVAMEVFDLAGNQVASLVDDMKAAGLHQATLSSTDVAQLASGVYVIRFRAGSFAASRKLVVLR
ncbi:MAG: hypothetical protein Rubg2KO_28430 [Rubricoccaceae bacterium]